MCGHDRYASLKQQGSPRGLSSAHFAAILVTATLSAGSAAGCKANASGAANADSGASEGPADGSRVVATRSRKAATGAATSPVIRATKEDNAKKCAALTPGQTPNGKNYASHIVAGAGRSHAADVTTYLASKGRCAYVVAAKGTAVVFDARSRRDRSLLGANLSKHFGTYVLAVSGRDEEQFVYELFSDGKLVDEYDSFPENDAGEDGNPTGGDIEVLLDATKSSAEPDSVETTLRRGHDTYGGYVYESARHRDLMRALNLPEWSALYGFGDFKSGKGPKEVAAKSVLATF